MRGIIGLIALVACLGLVGCKQGEGDRCQIDDDCESGLKCLPAEMDTLVCKPPAGVADAGPDAAPAADAGPDAAIPDAGDFDAGDPDAATPDAATPDAA